ncbi:MAG: hypothetical protein BGO01_02055 [Armatimonadetes bacterium 55-13]|nr:sigma-70 family RNA polymerase sigma factor [Armatimonadota bacterium]OJU65716.1 MAG: hypothetical protein BGO01_02055 [Armatimonadetes bacterium 55-13]
MVAVASHASQNEARNQIRFEKLVDGVRKKALSFALSLTRNRADAEDLLQFSLVKAWTHFESYQEDRPFQNWLLKIIVRSHLDAVRTLSRRPKVHSLDALVTLEDGLGHSYEPEDPSPLPDEPYNQTVIQEKVERALAELPESHRRIIHMCDVEDLSYAEIAEAEGLTVATVRSRLHRARKVARKALRS